MAESSSGGTDGAWSVYLSALKDWPKRHKEYLRQARLRRREGTVPLALALR